MKRQKGFTIIDLLIALATLGILTAIAIPALVAARNEADLKVCYGMEVVPRTAEEKDAARPYMKQRLAEHQAAFDAIVVEREALISSPPASTGLEVKERIQKLRDIAVRYDRMQDTLTTAKKVYYWRLGIEPDPEK